MSLEACAGIVERGDPDRFRAAMAAPVAARQILFPLYAFNVEVTRAPWVTKEDMIAEMRLQWWRDALDEIRNEGSVRKHEVVDGVKIILDAEGAECLDGLIAARRWDIYKESFEDTKHLEDYVDATSGNLMWTAARLLDAASETTVRDFAFASGVANLFRAIPTLESEGRKPLIDGTVDGVHALAETALKRLKRAKSAKHTVSSNSAAALISGFQAKPIIMHVLADPRCVSDGSLGQTPLKDSARFLNVSLRGWWR